MKVKPQFEYHIWFIVTLIATVLSAVVLPNPWLRGVAVCGFTIMCHLFGHKEGDVIGRTDEVQKAAEQAADEATSVKR